MWSCRRVALLSLFLAAPACALSLGGCSGSVGPGGGVGVADGGRKGDGGASDDGGGGALDAAGDAKQAGGDAKQAGGDGTQTGRDAKLPPADGPATQVDAKVPGCTKRLRATIGAAPTSASWRYGGGYGYPDTVDSTWCRTTVVATVAQLEAALKTATAGDTVYVKDGVELDLTGKSLCIPGGVWLAGGRGRGSLPGALLFTNTRSRTPLLKACGKNVRLTGLRLWGSDFAQCPPEYAAKTCSGTDRTGGVNCRDCEPSTYGIQALSGMDELEVDNCEMAGFSLAAISIAGSKKHHVHHNHLHHTQRQGLGYGVVLGSTSTSETSVLVEYNRFDYYRHAIAASGGAGNIYEARFNLTLEHTISHVYDMHGLNERFGNGSSVAGKRMDIHDNAIVAAGYYSFVLRGRPTEGAWFYRNCTARSKSSAVLQRFYTGNLTLDRDRSGAAAPNTYSASYDTCARRRFCFAMGGRGPWRYALASTLGVGDVAVADLDGDGRDDLFRTSGGTWYWSRSGTASWAQRNSSAYTLSSLHLADFDGDGKADVFRASGSSWVISSAGSGGWKTLRAATETLSQLGFGDFDGDGKTDVFKTEGGRWYWSRSGTAAWALLNTSGVTLSSLRFGDFDGDGKTDVFRASSGKWYISSAGRGGWKQINSSSTGIAAMRFGDFNGDGKTDVLTAGANHWTVSWGGASGWRRLAVVSLGVAALRLGDFDGDGKTDVLRAGCR